jgi:hypothetical protein
MNSATEKKEIDSQAATSDKLRGLVAQTPSLNNQDQKVEDYAAIVAYQGLFHDAAGDDSIPDSVKDAAEKNITMESMRNILFNRINAMNSAGELIDELKVRHSEFVLIQDKANAHVAFYAFRIGFYLLKLQTLRYSENKRDWGAWSNKNIPFIGKRSREKYMNFSSVPMVEKYLWLGVERLSEIGSYYSKFSDEDAMQLGPDPIGTLLKNKGLDDDIPFEQRKTKIDAIIEVYKLERMDVYVPVECMEEFLNIEAPLTGEERKYLKELAKTDKEAPKAHLDKIIAKELKRSEFVPKKEEASTAEADALETNSEKSVPNIDVQVTQLSQSIKPFLGEKATVDGKVSIEALESLIADLEAFKDKLRTLNSK